MKTKRIISVLLSLLMVISLVPMSVFADENVIAEEAEVLTAEAQTWESNGITWSFTSDGTLTLSGSGETVEEYNKYQYGFPGFNRTEVKKIVVGEGITGLASYTFANCTNLVCCL